MELRLAIDPPDALTVHLVDGTTRTTMTVPNVQAGIDSLARALDDAMTHGYGECFWPALEGGHYWWMFRREAESLDLATMWSRGGASGWQHVFRALDSAAWIRERLISESELLGRPRR